MLNRNCDSSLDPVTRPGIQPESKPAPLRLIAVAGAKKRSSRPASSSPAFTTNGLHLVGEVPSVRKQPDWYTPPGLKVAVAISEDGYKTPLLLRTMWVASLLCYAGVLVWFAN